MNGFKKIWYTIDDILFKLVRFVIFAATTAMVVVATVQVFMRYFFSMPMRWSNEFCCFMLVYAVFLGAAWALRNAEHVRLDISKFPLPPVIMTAMNVIATVAVYIFLILLLYYGVQFAIANGDSLTEVMKWPYITLYCVIPLSAALMLIGQTTCLLKKTDKEEVKA